MAPFLTIPSKRCGTPKSLSSRNATEVGQCLLSLFNWVNSYLWIHSFENLKGNLQGVPFKSFGQKYLFYVTLLAKKNLSALNWPKGVPLYLYSITSLGSFPGGCWHCYRGCWCCVCTCRFQTFLLYYKVKVGASSQGKWKN